MRFNRLEADAENRRHLLIGMAFSDQLQNRLLTRCQKTLSRYVLREIVLQQSLRDFPREEGIVGRERLHGGDQKTLGVGFQQKAPGTGLQSLPDQIVGIVHGWAVS